MVRSKTLLSVKIFPNFQTYSMAYSKHSEIGLRNQGVLQTEVIENFQIVFRLQYRIDNT